MDESGIRAVVDVLNLENPDPWKWLTDQEQPPENVNSNPLKAAREAAKIAVVGSAIEAISSAGVAWKYSKSPHGALLSLGAGAMFGLTFGYVHLWSLYSTGCNSIPPQIAN